MKKTDREFLELCKAGFKDIMEKSDSYVKYIDKYIASKKSDWDEEDIDMIDWLIRCCEKEYKELCNDRYGHQDIVSDLKRDCRKKWDWLESLKHKIISQSQWKPSDEQMEVLLSEVAAWENGCPKQKVLESLYNDLQNLKRG